jgi:transcriptional regulator with XRE-family HTH domain
MAGEDVREIAPEPNRVARNVAILMRWRDWNQSELSRRSGVSQRHISDLLRGLSDCTTEVTSQLAAAFAVPSWLLMVDDITEELLTTTDLKILVDACIHNPRGRKLILGAVDMVREPPEA